MTDEEVEVVARATGVHLLAVADAAQAYVTDPQRPIIWSDDANDTVEIEGLSMIYDGELDLVALARAAITALDACRGRVRVAWEQIPSSSDVQP